MKGSMVFRRHIPALDGLRGVAVLGVLLYHFGGEAERSLHSSGWLIQPCRFGWLGVDLFFVLSGFLITGILFDARSSAHYFRNFYMRRTLRIFPLYFGTLAVLFILAGMVPGVAQWLGRAYRFQGWFWLYGANILVALRGWNGPIDHFWTLAVEEHFYLVWPLVIFLLPRRHAMVACLLAIGGAILTRAALSRLPDGAVASYVLTPARVDALAIGGLVALGMRTRQSTRNWGNVARWAIFSSGMMLAVLVAAHRALGRHDHLFQIWGYSVGAVFFAGVLILSVVATGIWESLWSFAPLRSLGKLSYGLYVIHPLLEPFRIETFGKLTLAWIAAWPKLLFICYIAYALATSWAVAALSWHLFEKRFIALKRFFPEGTARPASHASHVPARAMPATNVPVAASI